MNWIIYISAMVTHRVRLIFFEHRIHTHITIYVCFKGFLWKPDTAISFVRFGALWKATKRTNAKMKFHFFVFGDLYNATKRTNDKTKWPQNLIMSRCRSVVLAPCGSRQNEQTTKRTSNHDQLNFDISR